MWRPLGHAKRNPKPVRERERKREEGIAEQKPAKVPAGMRSIKYRWNIDRNICFCTDIYCEFDLYSKGKILSKAETCKFGLRWYSLLYKLRKKSVMLEELFNNFMRHFKPFTSITWSKLFGFAWQLEFSSWFAAAYKSLIFKNCHLLRKNLY